MPDVSVVISTYNRSGMLREALACALCQVGVDLEVVVVDNGSTDDTARVLSGVDDARVRVIRNAVSLGPTGGRNTGLAAATGTWVAFLDDDDLWAPDKLRRQLDAAEAVGAGWSYTGCVYIDDRRQVLGGAPAPAPEEVVRTLPSAYVIPAGLSGMAFRRDLVDGDGLLDDRLRWQTDWDLSLRLLRTGPPAAVPAPLVAYRQHAGQVSRGAARYEPELEIMGAKFADLRDPGQRFDRGIQHRFVASEALRGGQRGMALTSYLRAVGAGDLGSLVRLLALLIPRTLHPFLRRRFLSDLAWIDAGKEWLAARPAATLRVVFVQRTLRRYRVPFLEEVRDRLADEGVELEVVHATTTLGGARRDVGEVPWATEVPARVIPLGPNGLVWLSLRHRLRHADLVITEQASRLVSNLALAARRLIGLPPPFALWGHGRNLGEGASRAGEALKAWLTRRADWWFAYTEGSARIVEAHGFPADRITVFSNATDTSALAAARRELGPDDVARARSSLGLVGDDPCLFVGNYAAAKRLDLLLEAADLVRAEVPGFELLLVGSGDQEQELAQAAAERPWMHVLGQRFDGDLAEVAAICRLLLVPAWAGLSVVDSFALALPIVVSAGLPHPPETEYVVDGVNGVVSDDGGTAGGYARTVIGLLREPERLAALAAGASASARDHTVEAMARNVTAGILAALERAGRR